MKDVEWRDLGREGRELLIAAGDAMKNAYCPESHFRVGAGLLTHSGDIFQGTNVENAAWTAGSCAEPAAVAAATTAGHRDFAMIAVIAEREDGPVQDVCAPCGGCRQVLYETVYRGQGDLTVIMSNTRMSNITVASIEELLPLVRWPDDAQPTTRADYLFLRASYTLQRSQSISGRRAAAAVGIADQRGTVCGGVLQERAAYPLTTCAVDAALSSVSLQRDVPSGTVALMRENDDPRCAPCGGCRQLLFEAAQTYGRSLDVVIGRPNGDRVVTNTDALLPLAFGPKTMG